MSAVPTITEPPSSAPPRDRRQGTAPPRTRDPGRGRDGGGDRGPSSGGEASQVAVTGIWIALAPILMLFLAFTSAYVVRQGLGRDWVPVSVPRLLWVNTLVLAASSVALERGRRRARQGESGGRWLLATLGLGLLFLGGQLLAWRELAARGIGLSATPYSSFFYLLTGAHGVHLAGGLLGLAAARLWPADGVGRLPRPVVLQVAAIYWHFLAVLWLGLFLLLLLWR